MDRVGQRVRVFWADEGEWFGGYVRDFSDADGFFVVYDDGDERWEASGASIQFEGDDRGDSRGEDDDDDQRDSDGGDDRRMMEPPASPSSGYDDDEHDGGGDEEFREALPVPAAYDQPSEGEDDDDDGAGGIDIGDRVRATSDYEAGIGSDEEDDGVIDPAIVNRFLVQDMGDSASDRGDSDGSESDQSAAGSEMPVTCSGLRNSARSSRSTPRIADQLAPSRGLLLGSVIRASGLPPVNRYPPSTFVKVSFAEAGDTAAASLMLRCKQSLASTEIVPQSADPVWTEDDDGEQEGAVDLNQSHFHLDLVPPKTPPSTTPDWRRVLGDVVFAVYAVDDAERSNRPQQVFIGQAVVSLQDLLRGLLSHAPSTTRCLQLLTRTGKRLPRSDDGSHPELFVAFHFVPEYENAVRREAIKHSRSSKASTTSRQADAKSSARSGQSKQLKSTKRTAWDYRRHLAASSGINRKRFESQVAKENVEFAKRLEWQHGRRAKRQAETKAQEKQRVTPPQYGARKHNHKASSSINRAKFSTQVSHENRVMGKRLLAITGAKEVKSSGKAARPAVSTAWADVGDSAGRDRDSAQAYAADRRQQRRLELDHRMEKAQAKYVKQNQLVEQVDELQDAVARLKSEIGELTRSCGRLDVVNRKDRHARDCLRVAAEKERGATAKRTISAASASSQRGERPRRSGEDGTDASPMRRQECELQDKERERLEAEKRRQSEQLLALKAEENQLDDSNQRCEEQLQFAQARQSFQREMQSGKNPAQLHFKTQEMKRRRHAMELSAAEEQQWELFQAHDELAQLQLAVQVLQQRLEGGEGGNQTRRQRQTSSEGSSSSIEYLTKKVARAKAKLESAEREATASRRQCEELAAAGTYEQMRTQVQELQHLVFLCQTQARHVRRAERRAGREQERVAADFERRLQSEQTDTEILFKKR